MQVITSVRVISPFSITVSRPCSNSWAGTAGATGGGWVWQSFSPEVYLYLWRSTKRTSDPWFGKRYWSHSFGKCFCQPHFLNIDLFLITYFLLRCGNLHCNSRKADWLPWGWKDKPPQVHIPRVGWSWQNAGHGLRASNSKNCWSNQGRSFLKNKYLPFTNEVEVLLTVKQD